MDIETKNWLGEFKPSAISKISQRFIKEFLSPNTQCEGTIVSQVATRKRRLDNGHAVSKTVIDLTDDADQPVEFVEYKRPQLVGRAPNGSADEASKFPRRHSRLLQDSIAVFEKVPDDLRLAEGNKIHGDKSIEDFPSLNGQIQHLRYVSIEENTIQASMIKNIVALVSVVEAAVDIREAELRIGLSKLLGTDNDIEEQTMQLTSFSSSTSWSVTSLIEDALGRQHALLKDEVQQDAHRRLYEDALSSREDVAAIYKQLPYVISDGRACLKNGNQIGGLERQNGMILKSLGEHDQKI
jgi:hypothetical protein